jgi:hypothetical protein
MPRPTSVRALLPVVLTLVALPAAGANAAGGRIDGYYTSPAGIADPTREARIYAVPHEGNTIVMRAYEQEGRQADIHYFNRMVQIPAVAQDLSTSGLSEDGSTLVLTDMKSAGATQSHFLILNAGTLRVRENVLLNGDFALDSISPDGTTIYLVHYLDRRDPNAYEVRAYDLESDRLLPEPIIDRRLAPRVMAGTPLTRAPSPDGAWAYTLYDGGGGRHAEPFVHALDTENARALCIDLPMLAHRRNGLWTAQLVPAADGSTLAVVDGGETLATIETGSWEVTEGAPEPAEAAAGADESGVEALPIAAAAGAVALCSLALVGRATRRREP